MSNWSSYGVDIFKSSFLYSLIISPLVYAALKILGVWIFRQRPLVELSKKTSTWPFSHRSLIECAKHDLLLPDTFRTHLNQLTRQISKRDSFVFIIFSLTFVLLDLLFDRYLNPVLEFILGIQITSSLQSILKPIATIEIVLSGLGALIFTLVTFIVARYKDQSDELRVMLKESRLKNIFLAAVTMAVPFVLLESRHHILTIILIVTLFWLYESFAKVYLLVTDPVIFQEKMSSFFRDRFAGLVKDAHIHRHAGYLFAEGLISLNAHMYYFFHDDKNEHLFTLKKSGVVTDIDLYYFRKLNQLIGNIILSQNPELVTIPENVSPLQKRGRDMQIGKLSIHIGGNISPNETIFSINKTDGLGHSYEVPRREVQMLLDKTFVVSDKKSTVSDHHKTEVKQKFNRGISMIRSGEMGEFNEICNLYADAVDIFLNHLRDTKSVHTKRMSIAQGGHWDSEIAWIKYDLYLLLKEAVAQSNLEAVKDVLGTIFSCMTESLSYRDHYVFRMFSWFCFDMYMLSVKAKNREIKELLYDRSWRYLKEISDIYLEPKLSETDSEEGYIDDLCDFADDVFIVVQQLVRESSKYDFDEFKKFIDLNSKIFERFISHYALDDLLGYHTRRLKRMKDLVFWGNTSQILSERRDNQTNDKLIAIAEKLNMTFNELVELYFDAKNYETEERMGWRSFERESVEEGIVYTSQLGLRADKLFIFLCIRSNCYAQIDIQSNYTKVYESFKETSSLFELITTISKSHDWDGILSEYYEKVLSLKTHLLLEADRAKRLIDERIINAEIDSSKVDSFYEDFLKGFSSESKIRNILRSENSEEAPDRLKPWGFWQFENKEVFLSDHDQTISYRGWGEHYGRQIAYSEDAAIAEAITKSATRKSYSDTLYRSLCSAYKQMSLEGFSPNLVVCTAFVDDLYFLPASQFTPSGYVKDEIRKEKLGFQGIIHLEGGISLDIINVGTSRIDEEEVLLIDTLRYALLIQYDPTSLDDKATDRRDQFVFRISDIKNDHQAFDMYASKMHKERSIKLEEAKSILQKMVLLKIVQRYELKILDKRACQLVKYRAQQANRDTQSV